MRTLLQVTMSPFGQPINEGDETGGPEVILCCEFARCLAHQLGQIESS